MGVVNLRPATPTDDVVVKAISSVFRPESFIPKVIAKLLREEGITLSPTEVAKLGDQLLASSKTDTLTIGVDESGHPVLSESQAQKRMERALRKLRPVSHADVA